MAYAEVLVGGVTNLIYPDFLSPPVTGKTFAGYVGDVLAFFLRTSLFSNRKVMLTWP